MSAVDGTAYRVDAVAPQVTSHRAAVTVSTPLTSSMVPEPYRRPIFRWSRSAGMPGRSVAGSPRRAMGVWRSAHSLPRHATTQRKERLCFSLRRGLRSWHNLYYRVARTRGKKLLVACSCRVQGSARECRIARLRRQKGIDYISLRPPSRHGRCSAALMMKVEWRRFEVGNVFTSRPFGSRRSPFRRRRLAQSRRCRSVRSRRARSRAGSSHGSLSPAIQSRRAG